MEKIVLDCQRIILMILLFALCNGRLDLSVGATDR